MNRIILTGANGFIGGHIAEYFCSQGVHPICLVRDERRAEFLRTLPVAIVQGDVTDPENLTRNFKDVDMVIHTAAKVSDWGRYEEFHAVNVVGTVNIMNAAIQAGVKNVIVTGSNSCYGEESSLDIKTENSPCNSHYQYFLDGVFPSALNFYRDTKAMANREAMALAERHGVNLTIIEPVWVYGEREYHTGFYEYLKTVRSGIPFFPGSATNKFHTIYARDLARLYFLAANARLAGVQRFLACDPTAEYQRELLEMFCREAGLTLPRRLPKTLVYPLAFAMEVIARLLRSRTSPLLTRAIVNIFYDNIEYSSEKARAVLNFAPEYTRQESIRKTVAWYKEHNLL